MNITRDVALFTLKHTTNPALAARLADHLGEDAIGTELQIHFPNEWVIAKQKSSAKIAAFAIKYCNDAATLAEITTKAKRISVRCALASNPSTPRTSVDFLLASAKERDEWDVRHAAEAALRPVAPTKSELERFEEALADSDTLRTSYSRESFLESILDLEIADQPVALAKVLETAKEVDPRWIPQLLIGHRCKVSRISDHLVELINADPIELLVELSAEHRSAILLDIVRDLASSRSYRNAEPGVVDLALARLIVADVPAELVKTARYISDLQVWATPEAVDLFLSHPGWVSVMVNHTMTETQLTQLIEVTPPKERHVLFTRLGRFEKTRAFALELFSKLPEGESIHDHDEAQAVLDVCDSADDELVGILKRRIADPLRASYLSGGWSINRMTILPSIDELDELVELVNNNTVTAREVLQSVRSRGFTTEMSNRLIDTLPGGCAWAMRDPGSTSKYVFDRLVTTGADIELIMDQLSSNPGAPLNIMCQALRRLASVQAS